MNELNFDGKGIIYDKYRPSYPTEVYDFILQCFSELGTITVADIGAGTGKFAQGFLDRGIKTICVEPNFDMKSVMDAKFRNHKNYLGVIKSAENTGLQANSVDCITVAQAFHWFDTELFRKECLRILKDTGKIFLIWNVKDETDCAIKELGDINRRYCAKFKGFSGGVTRLKDMQFDDFYKGSVVSCKIFQNNTLYATEKDFIGHCLSTSYALTVSARDYDAYIQELTAFYNKYKSKEGLFFKNNTNIYFGEIKCGKNVER